MTTTIKTKDQIIGELREVRAWAHEYGDIETWKKNLKDEWNQDKTDGYGYAMIAIYEHINKILEENSTIPYGI